jgi:hypothetical protein
MFGGGSRQIAPEYRVRDKELRTRPYNDALNTLTSKICGELGLPGNDVCLFETRTAFDCVLRHKVTKMGDLEDNIGKCSIHIDNMKNNIGFMNPSSGKDHRRVLDTYLTDIQYMRKSFV